MEQQRREPKIEELVSIDTEKYGILSNVIESRGSRDFSKFVISELVTGRKQRIILTGEPGNGKTTLMHQIIGALEDNAKMLGIDISSMTTLYESYLTGDPLFDDTQEMNELMVSDIKRKEKNNPDTRHIIENPAVGGTDWKDRGVSAFNSFLNNPAEIDKTIFVRILVNPLVQRRGIYLRQYMKDVAEENVFSELARLNVKLKGATQGELTGRDIKQIFGRMANERQVRQIRVEQEELENEWYEKNMLKREQMKSGLNDFNVDQADMYQILNDFGMLVRDAEGQARVMANVDQEMTNFQAVYFEDEFNSKGIPFSSRAILFNQYNPKSVELDLSRFKK